MNFSYSALSEYLSCGLKYKFRHIDKIKEPKTPTQVFGTLIHSALQFAHSQSLVPPTLEETLDFFTRNWNAAIYDDPQEERAAFTLGIDILRRYYADNDIAAARVVALESRFRFTIGEGDDAHVISGTIDRIDRTDTGYEIIDYKTSRKAPSQEVVDNDLQLTVYARAFLERYPAERENIDNVVVSLYYVRPGIKISSRRTLEQIAALDTQVQEVAAAIAAEKFAPTVSHLCDYCGYQRLCPMQKHRFKDAVRDDNDEAVRAAIDELYELKKKMREDAARAKQLQEKIRTFMDAKGLGRAFGARAVVALSERVTRTYDPTVVRSILERAGVWDDVVSVNATALKKVLPTLPQDVRDAIEAAAQEKRSEALTIKRVA